MLAQGFDGVKTGITPTAGPCLCSAYKHVSETTGPEGIIFVITILSSKDLDSRWNETVRLTMWAIAKFEEDYAEIVRKKVARK